MILINVLGPQDVVQNVQRDITRHLSDKARLMIWNFAIFHNICHFHWITAIFPTPRLQFPCQIWTKPLTKSCPAVNDKTWQQHKWPHRKFHMTAYPGNGGFYPFLKNAFTKPQQGFLHYHDYWIWWLYIVNSSRPSDACIYARKLGHHWFR